MVLPGQIIATIPKIMKRINATNKTPLQTVKSNFVWNANRVNAPHTTAVAPTAKTTVSGGSLDVILPNIKDSAKVNSPKNMKLVGAVRRTLSQHAIAIIVTTSTARATQINSRCAARKFFVPG